MGNLNGEVLLCKGGTFKLAEAKLKELQNWRMNKVYDEDDYKKQSSISVRWVLTEKMIEGKYRSKLDYADVALKMLAEIM